jgi:hypothetical protein
MPRVVEKFAAAGLALPTGLMDHSVEIN